MRTDSTSVTYTCGGCGTETTVPKAPTDAPPQAPDWADVTVVQRGRPSRSQTLCPECCNRVLVAITGGGT